MAGHARLAKYLAIANQLREEITAGELPEGGMLPGEDTLAARFAVTRNTVRRALDVLRTDGLIDTAHGTGSWVRRTTPRRYLGPDRYRPMAGRGQASAMVSTADLETPMLGGTEVRHAVRTASVMPEHLIEWLGAEANHLVIERQAAFRVDGRVQQLWTSWLPLTLVRGTRLEDSGCDPWAGTTIALLAECGWHFSHAREQVWPRMPREDVAKTLGITTGIPLLQVDRVMYFRPAGGDRLVPMEAAVVLLPGDSTVLVSDVG